MSYNALRRGRRSIRGQVYLITASTLGRRRLFANFDEAAVVAREISRSGREGRWTLLAWVIMPDHIHLLVQLQAGTLEATVGRLKGRCSRLLGIGTRRGWKVWQPGFHDRALRAETSVVCAARYVVTNPLRAGIVASLRDYPFWDACWLDDPCRAEARPTGPRASG